MVSLLFYLKKSKPDSAGSAMIYLRITIRDKRVEFSPGRKTHPYKWNASNSMVQGFSEDIRQLNAYLNNMRTNLYKQAEKLKDNDLSLTAVSLGDAYLGKDQKFKMLLEIFQDHNNQVESLVGKDFAESTAERYRTAKSHLAEYIRNDYKKNDIPVKQVDHAFITGFEYYLKTKRKCSHNSAVKYVVNFKKIIRIAYANGWIVKDPFANRKVRLKNVEREFLTAEEL